MISCHQCQELLPEYSLGELEGTDLRKVKYHLNNCRKCAVEAAEYRRVWNLLPYTLEPVEPPSGLKVQLLERVKTSPRADKRERATKKSKRKRVGSTVSFRLDRQHKLLAVAASILVCVLALSSLNWGNDDPTDSLFANQEIKNRVERLANSFETKVPLIGDDGMPNYVYVSMRKGEGYASLNAKPSAYAIWNRESDKWHLFVEEMAVAGEPGSDYTLRLEDAQGGLVAVKNISASSIGKTGMAFDSRTDRPITRAVILSGSALVSNASRQSGGTIIFEANLITPVVPVSVN